jgi:hypothetical protein
MFLPLMLAYVFIGCVVGAVIFAAAPAAGSGGGRGANGPPPLFLASIVFMEFGIFALIMAYAALVPAIQIQHLRTGSVLAAFHFREVWQIIRSHPVDYIMFIVVGFALYIGASLLGEIMCFVGLFFTVPLALYVEGVFLGRYCAWLDAVGDQG